MIQRYFGVQRQAKKKMMLTTKIHKIFKTHQKKIIRYRQTKCHFNNRRALQPKECAVAMALRPATPAPTTDHRSRKTNEASPQFKNQNPTSQTSSKKTSSNPPKEG